MIPLREPGASPRRSSHRRPCACPRCRAARREALIERLADDSLSVALRHAQAFDGGLGPEAGVRRASTDILYACVRVNWHDPIALQTFLAGVVPTPYKKPGQYLYRIWEKRDPKPLYLGRVTNQSVFLRVKGHENLIKTEKYKRTKARAVKKGVAPPATVQVTEALNSPARRPNISVQVGEYAMNFSFNTPCMSPISGGNVQRSPALTAAIEKLYHSRSASRLNLRSEPRFEKDEAGGL